MVVERKEKRWCTATRSLCGCMVRSDQASGMDPRNASAARCMPSEVPETIGILHYRHLWCLHVVFSVLKYRYRTIFYILSPLPSILGLSEQYITTTPLATVPNNIKKMWEPSIQLILLHPCVQSTPIYQNMPRHWVHCLSECEIFRMFLNSFVLLAMSTVLFLQGSVIFWFILLYVSVICFFLEASLCFRGVGRYLPSKD